MQSTKIPIAGWSLLDFLNVLNLLTVKYWDIQKAASVRTCVCVCVFVVTYMLRREEDKPRSGRHALGLHLWEILVPSDHHAVHVGNGAPC